MLDNFPISLVLAFHKNIKESKGTKNLIKQAKEKNIKTILVDY
jgi:hypothetical protein